MGHSGQDFGALFQGNTQRQGGAQHIQGVIHHESAGDVHPDGYFFLFCHSGESDMVSSQADILRPQVAFRFFAVSQHFAGSIFHQPPSPGVVGVHHAGVAVSEQDGLGVAVSLHSLVEIQVVLGQVRKDAHGVMDTVHPVQVQGMGGCLHHHMGTAPIPHLGQKPLQFKRFRSSPLRGKGLLPDHVLVGTDQAHLGPQSLLQDGLEQIGGGGLAVGSGDGHHGHGIGGMAIKVSAHHRQGMAGIRHPDIGNLPLWRFFAQHRCRAGLHSLADECMAVHGEAGHGYEQVAGPGLAGVIAHTGNLHFQICRGFQNRQSL